MENDDDYGMIQYFDMHDYINRIQVRATDSYVGRVFHQPHERVYWLVTDITWGFVKLVNTMDRDDKRTIPHEDFLDKYKEKI